VRKPSATAVDGAPAPPPGCNLGRIYPGDDGSGCQPGEGAEVANGIVAAAAEQCEYAREVHEDATHSDPGVAAARLARRQLRARAFFGFETYPRTGGRRSETLRGDLASASSANCSNTDAGQSSPHTGSDKYR
jgi:hypothetical protein